MKDKTYINTRAYGKLKAKQPRSKDELSNEDAVVSVSKLLDQFFK